MKPCCGAPVILEPVPGAAFYPRREICSVHGYPTERNQAVFSTKEEPESYNDYVSEIASPADVIEIGGKEIALY